MRGSFFFALVAVLSFGCTNEDVGSVSAASTVSDCDVDAYGVFPSGDEFSGEARDVDGTETIDWEHVTASGPIFLTEAGSITCNINGSTNADFVGSGTATVGGEPGYSYLIYIEDNREAPTIVCTCDEDDDRGHGNDGDCSDDDNPGNSSGCNRSDTGAAHANTGGCTCESIPAPGTPDVYNIQIFGPDGFYYDFAGDVVDGDISITPVP